MDPSLPDFERFMSALHRQGQVQQPPQPHFPNGRNPPGRAHFQGEQPVRGVSQHFNHGQPRGRNGGPNGQGRGGGGGMGNPFDRFDQRSMSATPHPRNFPFSGEPIFNQGAQGFQNTYNNAFGTGYTGPGNYGATPRMTKPERNTKLRGNGRPATSATHKTNDRPQGNSWPSSGNGQPPVQPSKGAPARGQAQNSTFKSQVNDLKERGNYAHKNDHHENAIEFYSQALRVAMKSTEKGNGGDRVDDKTFAQLYSNRSLMLSMCGYLEGSLEDAQKCIEHDPSWFKGYWRVLQALKAMGLNRDAFMIAMDALMRLTMAKDAEINFMMEAITLGVELHVDDLLPEGFVADAENWSEIFKRLAGENKWHIMKTLFEEGIDSNMDRCGKNVFLMDLVKYCLQNPGHGGAMEWGQKLAIELLQNQCDYPKDKAENPNTITLLKSVLDIGIQAGRFQLLKYLLANYDKSPARRNQQDMNGNTLLHHVAMSPSQGQGHLVALELLLNCNLDADIKNSEGRKAVSYVDKTSPLYKRLMEAEKKRSEQGLREMKRFIADGDQFTKLKKLAKAIESYDKAIGLCEKLQGNGMSNRDVSILLCKLSQIKFEQNKSVLALEDAQKAVEKDATCFESQRQLAKVQEAVKKHDEAAETLFAAFGILRKNDTERYMDDILFDLAVLSPKVSGKSPGRFINRCVAKPAIWSIVVTRLSGRRAWESLNLIFLGGGNGHKKGVGGVATGCSAKKVYLAPIVSEYVKNFESWTRWIEDLLVELIVHGADPNRLADHRDEHPMVIALDVGIETGSYKLLGTLFKYMKKHTDNLGRNLFHLLAIMSHRKGLEIPNPYELMRLLADNDVDPCQRDSGGYLPIGHTNVYSALHPFLIKLMRDHEQRKKTTQAEKSKAAEQTRAQSNKPEKEKPKKRCEKCQEDYVEAADTKASKPGLTVRLCVGIIREKKHTPAEHNRWMRSSQSLALKTMISEREVTKSLTTLESEDYTFFVRSAVPEHWWLVEQLIDGYSANDTSNLAKDINLTLFFGLSTGNYHRSSLKRRYEALEKILLAGASANIRSGRHVPLEAAVEGEDWGAIPLLIRYGASPEVLTLTSGDTPLHVALQIAMFKDAGNFDVLRCLLDLHAGDADKYIYLHPSTQDNSGDTLFHVAAQGQCTRVARKAVAFLFDSSVNPNLRNKASKTALQCLQRKDDPRTQDIRMAGEKFSLPTKATKEKTGKGKKKKQSQTVEENIQELVVSREEKIQVAPKEKLEAVDVRVRNKVARCKDDIRKLLDKLDIEILVDGDSVSEEEFQDGCSDVTHSRSHSASPEPAELKAQDGDGAEDLEKKNDNADDYQTCSEGEEQDNLDRFVMGVENVPEAATKSEVSYPNIKSSQNLTEKLVKEAVAGGQLDYPSDPDLDETLSLDGSCGNLVFVSDPDIDTCSSHDGSDGSCDIDDVGDRASPEIPDQETAACGVSEKAEVIPWNSETPPLDVSNSEASEVDLDEEIAHLDANANVSNCVKKDKAAEVGDESGEIMVPGVDYWVTRAPVKPEDKWAGEDEDDEPGALAETEEYSSGEEAGASDLANTEQYGNGDGAGDEWDGEDEDDEPGAIAETEEYASGEEVGASDLANTEQYGNGVGAGDKWDGEDEDDEPGAIAGTEEHSSGEEAGFSDFANTEQYKNGDKAGSEADLKNGEANEVHPTDADPPNGDQTTVAVNLDREGEYEGDVDEAISDGEDDDDDDDDDDGDDVDNIDDGVLDESVFNDLEWDMECTAEVWKILCRKDMDYNMKALIVKKLKMLGSGNHQKRLCKPLRRVPKSILLYEAKLTKAARIIWEIAIAFSSRRSDLPNIRLESEETETETAGKIYAQIIRIWDIVFDHDNIYRSVQKIIGSHSKGEQCLIQKNLKGVKGKAVDYWQKGKRLPMLFTEIKGMLGPLEPDDARWARFFPPASSKETEYHIMKFYSFDSSLVNNILHNHGEKLDFPFRVTELEHAIINLQPKSPCPLLLLGRSGTGKTTCCLYRLWTSFVRYWEKADAESPLLPRAVAFVSTQDEENEDGGDAEDDGEEGTDESDEDETIESSDEEQDEANVHEVIYEHLHQIFITKNPVLCTEVNKNFKLLSHAFPRAQPHVAVENETLPHRLQLADPCAFPLFLTSRQFLMILDGSLPEPYFFKRNQDGSIEREIAGWGKDDGPLTFIPDFDFDDEDEADELGDDAVGERDPLQAPGVQRQPNLDARKEVTYEVFAFELWSLMNKKHKASCHPSLVWTEINSFIKGSMEALNSKKGYLDKDEYLQLGVKRAPNFTGNREQVYELFKMYQVLMKQRRYFDEMDVIFSLYNRIKAMEKPEWAIHQIYVDETQDFTQAELCLLIRCCQNPNDMFLTGDTAQSIMRGVAFRFSDLKSLFYYARESLKAMGKTEAVGVPKKVYQLTHNYRSHAGILNLASAIVDIMLHFFPESFDHLDKDKGLFDGPKPVMIECCDYSDLAMVLRGNKRETSQIEFGAHQVILVVNDKARDTLPEELSFGLVLTIYESKGLEFDDVLLYNFFKDSQAKNEWRIVCKFLDELIDGYQNQPSDSQNVDGLADINIDVLNSSNRPRPLDFDPEKHKILNSELKHLYTAITRARVNIWIFDEDEEARKPMFEYFKALNLVQSVEGKDDKDARQGMLELFSKSSTKQEWKEQGDQFFRQRLYGVAAKCYDKSGEKKLYQLSLAHQQALEASRIVDNKRLLREKFLLVSLEYLKCDHYIEAAKCLQNAHEYQFAAELYEKLKEYPRAADMYKRVKMTQKTSRMMELAKDYGAAIRLEYEEKRYDEAIDVLRRYQKTVEHYEKKGQPIPREVLRRKPDAHLTLKHLATRSAEQHFKNKTYKKMMEALDHLELDAAVTFLGAHEMKERAAGLLLQYGKNVEAAQMYRNLDQIKKAMDCIEGYDDDRDVRSLLAQLKLAQARLLLREGKAEVVEELVRTAKPLFEKERDTTRAAECLLLQACTSSTRQKELLERARELFAKVNCTIGVVECAFQLVKLCPDACTQAQCDGVILWAIKIGFDLVDGLLHRSGGATALAGEAVKLCQRFYGLRNTGSEKLEVLIHEAPRILNLFTAEVDKRKVTLEMNKEDVHGIIVKELLTKKLTKLCNFVRQVYQKTRLPLMPCAMYRSGGVCPGASQGCPFMHRPQSKETFKDLVRLTMSLMELDGYLADALNSRQLGDGEKDCIRKMTSGDINGSCAELIGMFYPTDQIEARVFNTVHQSFNTIKLIRNLGTIKHLLRYADAKKVEYEAKSKYADILCADMFFCLQMVYMLCNKKEKMNAVLARTVQAQANLPKTIVSTGFESVKDRNKTVSVNVFYHLFNMFHILYQLKNPRDAIGSCNKYFFLVAVRGDPLMVPSFSNAMMMLEYQLALCTCMYLRHSGHVSHTFLPKSYLSHITFWDSNVAQKAYTFSCVQNFPVEAYYLSRLRGGLWSLIKIFCGLESESFYMWASFNSNSDSCRNGDAERVFVFALILFLNANLMIPNQHFQRGKKLCLENILMCDINDLDLSNSPCPQRLKDAVHAVKTARGHQDIAKALGKLLSERGEEGLVRCIWKGADSSGKPTVHCQKLETYDTLQKGFHDFKFDDLKESKSKEAVREELNAGKVETESEEQDQFTYIQNVLEEPVLVEQAEEAATYQDEQHEVEDPDLRVDDTMCSTCGVHFIAVKPDHAVAGAAGDPQATEVSLPSESAILGSGFGDGPSESDAVTRQEHEVSDKHKLKVEQCKCFKDVLKQRSEPIIQKAKQIVAKDHPTFPSEELRMPRHQIETLRLELNKAIEMVRSNRDWANWNEVRIATKKLQDSNNELIEKVFAWDKEQQAKMASAGVLDVKAATPEPDPEDIENEILEKVVDGPFNKRRKEQKKPRPNRSHRKGKPKDR